MLKKNVEIFHQGYLVKSPPSGSNLLFKARWRRRFFTLKQGELPAQFFLEYYTDESCRKRKGVIDLDQVEQIDAGLRLDKQSIKFQHIFDMKTPNRTYYLAADTEKEMKDWVMVICQVCNLQEAEEKGNDTNAIQCKNYNLISHPDFEAKVIIQKDENSTASTTINSNSNTTESTQVSSRFDNLSIVNEYENDNIASLQSNSLNNEMSNGQNYSNLCALPIQEQTTRTSKTVNKSTGAIKKIPKNLDLMKDDKINNNNQEETNNFRSSGAYIPLSDCFSGSPIFFKNEGDPKTPLNSLDPRFYETPKSHQTNIGLNLTDDQKDSIPNSPKRSNVSSAIETSRNSSPTDDDDGGSSEDEEDWKSVKLRNNQKTSFNTSTEDVAITAKQCYLKISATNNPLPLPPKRISLVLDKKNEISDSEENISPIGPKDISSVVDDQYDIPRSYHLPSKMDYRSVGLMTSTPNLLSSPGSMNLNFYSNAAPSENNFFRFDSIDSQPPEVNRCLKPGKDSNSTNSLFAPKVDRKLKPANFHKSSRNNTLNSKDIENFSPSEFDESVTMNDSMISHGSRATLSLKNDEKLQYLDLDHDSPPKGSLSFIGSVTSIASHHPSELSIYGSIKENPGINYTTVDFLKTVAFNRVREDSEMIRASKSKHNK